MQTEGKRWLWPGYSCEPSPGLDAKRPANSHSGAAWESNPPWTGLPPNTGFEDRAGHQTERRSACCHITRRATRQRDGLTGRTPRRLGSAASRQRDLADASRPAIATSGGAAGAARRPPAE